jgi:hypothetical protein
MDGYIIANSGLSDDEALAVSYHTFGRTMQEAWLRHIGREYREDSATIINRWAQKGWCPRECTLEATRP